MSNKSKKEREDEINQPTKRPEVTDDAKATSKSSITPEGKYTPGYEIEENIINSAAKQQEEKTKKAGEKNEESEEPGTARTTATTPRQTENTSLQREEKEQKEKEREERFNRNEQRNEYHYGVEQEYHGYPRQERSPEDEFEEFVTNRARQRGPQGYAQQQPQEYSQQPQLPRQEHLRYQQRYNAQQRQDYQEPYARQFSSREPQAEWQQHQQQYMQQQQPQSDWRYRQQQYMPPQQPQSEWQQRQPQRYMTQPQPQPQAEWRHSEEQYVPQQRERSRRQERRQQYMPPQQYTPPSRAHLMEDFEVDQPYGDYQGYGNRPYRQERNPGMMSNFNPYERWEHERFNEPERERQFEDRYRRQNTAYRFGNDVNYGFGSVDDEYQNPFQRAENSREFGRGRANEQYGRGSGDWSNQGQGYTDYDRGRYWEENAEWGRRTEDRREDRERSEPSHHTSRHYFGDDYVPRYSNDWSAGFEDVYQRGLNEDPWYGTRRDNDNRNTWQNTDRFENRNERNKRNSEDDETRSRYNDERTPRYDEDYQRSSSSGRNQPPQEQARGRSSTRNEREERQHSRKPKGRRHH